MSFRGRAGAMRAYASRPAQILALSMAETNEDIERRSAAIVNGRGGGAGRFTLSGGAGLLSVGGGGTGGGYLELRKQGELPDQRLRAIGPDRRRRAVPDLEGRTGQGAFKTRANRIHWRARNGCAAVVRLGPGPSAGWNRAGAQGAGHLAAPGMGAAGTIAAFERSPSSRLASQIVGNGSASYCAPILLNSFDLNVVKQPQRGRRLPERMHDATTLHA